MRRWIEGLLLVAGIAGLGVWCGEKAVSTIWEAWANHVFDVQLSEGPARTALPDGSPGRATPSSPKSSRETPSNDGGIIGRLTIPRLKLSAMVREGVRENTLSLALGHIPDTALPGQTGNVAVAGHRDTLFRGLREIQKYDLIRFETLSGSYLYQVKSMEIVDPKEVSVLRPDRYDELTLVTCYPFNYIGSAPQRFIVKAREVDRTVRAASRQQVSFVQGGGK